MLILATLALSALQAPTPPQAPPVPAAVAFSACGKTNCTCGCANGAPCVCAAPVTHNYDVGNGRIVVASSWAEAYKRAGISNAAVPAPAPAPASPVFAPQAYTVPQVVPAAYGSSYAFPQAFGYSMPSYGSYGGASCPTGG